MNTIKLDESFIIKPDANNFTLIKEEHTGVINPDTGKEVISRGVWYPPTLKDALKRYMKESLRTCDGIEEVLKRIDEVESKIDNLKL